jgi:hypothetical protein
MFRRLASALGLLCLVAAGAAAQSPPTAAPSASPSPGKTSDPRAVRLFEEARDVWRARTDVPYLHYGALVRYLHNGHVFDNWWDAWARTSDDQLSLDRLVDPVEDRRRLGGIPFSIFGFTFFDTNKDSEPIRLDEPRISPSESFGLVARPGAVLAPSVDDPNESRNPLDSPNPLDSANLPEGPATPDTPSAGELPILRAAPNPQGTALHQIIRVEAERDYRIELAGTEQLRDGPAVHLTLVPLRSPTINRLRDLWIDPETHRTMQLRVAGILNGKPYDGVTWTVHYVELQGRNYLQQVYADQPLHFGLDTVIPKFEIDLVDYHFPTEVPKFTFDKPFGL